MESNDIRDAVRDAYGRIAREASGDEGCGCAPTCCGGGDKAEAFARALGYADDDLAALPEGSNLGLSCGNPTAFAALREGETVLDLGSGAGLDAFTARRKVGPTGRVIGVDMTPEMVSRSRAIAATAGFTNVEFRLGEIENLPVADASVDLVLSNCVINLSPDKRRVFREISRVLKPGGRVSISDMALLRPLPEAVRHDVAAYVGCVAGAVLIEEYEAAMRAAGLTDVVVEPKAGSYTPEDFAVSVNVRAAKPSRQPV